MSTTTHTLTIPDDLLAWASQPEVSVHFARPWAQEVAQVLAEGADAPLRGRATERLLARLEALCAEAIRHGRQELLLGIDLFTAEWLGLKYTFDTPQGQLVFGRGERWNYQELAVIVRAGVPPEQGPHLMACKDLLAGTFPSAQIDAIIDPHEVAPSACADCKTTDAVVMISMEHGSEYCGKCWADLVED